MALLVNEMRRVYEGMNAMILFMLTAKTTSPQTKRLTRCHAGAWETGAYPGYVGRPAACTSTPLVSEDCAINDPSIRDCWASDMEEVRGQLNFSSSQSVQKVLGLW